jgi:hypothetical protein
VQPLADERGARLPVAHLGLERLDLVRPDVGRVRGDEVPAALGGDFEAARAQLDVQPGQLGVLGRQGERVGRRVDRGDACGGKLVGDGERDRPGAGTDVEDAGLVAELGQEREAALDENLGLGARHERA